MPVPLTLWLSSRHRHRGHESHDSLFSPRAFHGIQVCRLFTCTCNCRQRRHRLYILRHHPELPHQSSHSCHEYLWRSLLFHETKGDPRSGLSESYPHCQSTPNPYHGIPIRTRSYLHHFVRGCSVRRICSRWCHLRRLEEKVYRVYIPSFVVSQSANRHCFYWSTVRQPVVVY